MRHPTEGVLRRLLDEPAGVADGDRNHVADCAHCLHGLAAVRSDAALVDAALAPQTGTELDLSAAWRRLSSGIPAAGTEQSASQVTAGRINTALRRPVVAAALAVTVVLAGAGTAAANNWLPIFRTEKIAPISMSTADLIALPDLSGYGDVAVNGDPGLRRVASASAAAAETGLEVPTVADLPRGVSGEPSFQVAQKVTATFTFSADRAADTAAKAGKTLPPPPPGLNGSEVRLEAGPGLAAIWQASGVPALVVGRAVAPTAFSSGLPFETVRDYVLSLPGLPRSVAAQLRTFNADGSTLPLPVNSDQLATSSAKVNGSSATVVSTRDRTMAAVVWVKDGVVTAVAGPLDTDEVLSVARGLR